MKALNELLKITVQNKSSDLHLTVGVSPTIRINGKLNKLNLEKLTKEDTEAYAKEILKELYKEYLEKGEMDTSYSVAGIGRFRVNVYKQRGSSTLAIRVVGLKVPTLNDIKVPDIIKQLTKEQRGMILVTGSTGSGKSTTLAAMINEINSTRAEHIITLEDPIEFLHKHNKSIVNQREIGRDTKNYSDALRAMLREDPDVILVGEMRDLETISIALTAAETGHLVLSTLHTINAVKTIDRIIDVFPQHQQQQIRFQLATVIKGIISQQLIPKINGEERICAYETMIATPAIQNLIREGKTHQIESSMQTGAKYGMKTMDMALVELYKSKQISYEEVINYALDKELIVRMMTM